MAFKPLELPRPYNYGFVSTEQGSPPIMSVRPDPIQIDPERIDRMTANLAPNLVMPDIVRVQWGAGDYGVLQELYKIMADQPTNLVGIDKPCACRQLTKWGYPLNPADWAPEQFEELMAVHAGQPNPLSLLGGF